jgi:pimeloyl-ACP methyl ester carboxylesterase
MIVILPGFGSSAACWASSYQFLKQKHQQVAILETLGVSGAEAMDLAEAAQLLNRFLSEKGAPEAHLVGHSMGGYIALEFLNLFPQRVKSLTLVHSHPFEDSAERKENRKKQADFILKHGTEAYLKPFYEGLFHPDFTANHPDLIASLRQNFQEKSNEKALSNALLAMQKRPERTLALANYAGKINLIMGTDDPFIPEAEASKIMALNPRVRCHKLSGVAHMSMVEAPEQLNELFSDLFPL